jgi:small subunit ribosomal protein S9
MIKPKTAEKQTSAKKEATVQANATPKKAVVSRKSGKIVTSKIGGVGRRKSSVARVWLSRGTGECVVNDKDLTTYFPTDKTRLEALKPLILCGLSEKYTVTVNVVGGGHCSQADAVKLGLARALVKDNEDLKSTLRSHGLLTVDARLKERKKPGQKGARRKFQFVKR